MVSTYLSPLSFFLPFLISLPRHWHKSPLQHQHHTSSKVPPASFSFSSKVPLETYHIHEGSALPFSPHKIPLFNFFKFSFFVRVQEIPSLSLGVYIVWVFAFWDPFGGMASSTNGTFLCHYDCCCTRAICLNRGIFHHKTRVSDNNTYLTVYFLLLYT